MAEKGEEKGGIPGLMGIWQAAYQSGSRAFFDAQEDFGRMCKTLVDQGIDLQSGGIKIARQSIEAGNAVYESVMKTSGESIKRGVDVMTTLCVNPWRRQLEEFNKILFGG